MADGSVRDVIHWPENKDCSKFAKAWGNPILLFPAHFNAGEIAQWKDAKGAVSDASARVRAMGV